MKFGKLALLIFFSAAIIAGCKKSDQFSDVPSIAFKSLTIREDALGFDSVSTLVITFNDGDGDIGNLQYDGVPNNFNIDRYSKSNGNWSHDSLSIPLGGHLPFITPTGNNKAIKGEITTDISLPFPRVLDTIRYDVYIVDRALHKSNTITTPEIVITTH